MFACLAESEPQLCSREGPSKYSTGFSTGATCLRRIEKLDEGGLLIWGLGGIIPHSLHQNYYYQ